MSVRPGAVAKSIARRREGGVNKVASNPRIRLSDVIKAMDIQAAEVDKLRKEVATLRRKLAIFEKHLT